MNALGVTDVHDHHGNVIGHALVETPAPGILAVTLVLNEGEGRYEV